MTLQSKRFYRLHTGSIAALLLGLLWMAPAPAATTGRGMLTVRSSHSVTATVARLTRIVKKNHLQLIAVVNHSGAARKVGLPLRPTELVIFGNPLLGTKMMDLNQTAGLDLPLKVLVWQNAQGQTWLGYNNPTYLAQRYGIAPSAPVIQKMSAAMKRLTAAAAGS